MPIREDFNPGDAKPQPGTDSVRAERSNQLPALDLVTISQQGARAVGVDVAQQSDGPAKKTEAPPVLGVEAIAKQEEVGRASDTGAVKPTEWRVMGRNGCPVTISLEKDSHGKVSMRVPHDLETYETIAALLNPDGRTSPRPNSRVEFSSVQVGKDGEVSLTRQLENNCELTISLRPQGASTATITNEAGCAVEYDQRGIAIKVVNLDSDTNRMQVYRLGGDEQWHMQSAGTSDSALKNFMVSNGEKRGEWRFQYDLGGERQFRKDVGGETTIIDFDKEREERDEKSRESESVKSWQAEIAPEKPAQLLARLLQGNLTEEQSKFAMQTAVEKIGADLYWQGAEKVDLQISEMMDLFDQNYHPIDANKDYSWSMNEINEALSSGKFSGKTRQLLLEMKSNYKAMSQLIDESRGGADRTVDGVSSRDLQEFIRRHGGERGSYFAQMQKDLQMVVPGAEIGMYRDASELVIRDSTSQKTIVIKLGGTRQAFPLRAR